MTCEFHFRCLGRETIVSRGQWMRIGLTAVAEGSAMCAVVYKDNEDERQA